MDTKTVVVIGSGGREHAIVEAFSKSANVGKIYSVPGNSGTSYKAENVDIPVKPPFAQLSSFINEVKADLVFIGPEQPLVDGAADVLEATGAAVCGPGKAGAMLEGSKSFTKKLLKKYNIPTADYDEFDNFEGALNFIKTHKAPLVLKADGLAAGKGVIIAHSEEEAHKALELYFKEKKFGSAADKIIIEDFLEGEEASVIAFTDGENVKLLSPSQDHKRVYDNDEGPNTGGMGAYSPIKLLNEAQLKEIENGIIKAVVEALKKEGVIYKGLLYAGLMIKEGKASVVEFNCRLGDPETQVILPLLESDFYELSYAAATGGLDKVEVRNSGKQALCVVAAAAGYPGAYEKGHKIEGDIARMDDEIQVYHAGMKTNEYGSVSSGGRVFAVTAIGDSLKDAREKAYSFIGKEIHFEAMHFRKDIAYKGL